MGNPNEEISKKGVVLGFSEKRKLTEEEIAKRKKEPEQKREKKIKLLKNDIETYFKDYIIAGLTKKIDQKIEKIETLDIGDGFKLNKEILDFRAYIAPIIAQFRTYFDELKELGENNFLVDLLKDLVEDNFKNLLSGEIIEKDEIIRGLEAFKNSLEETFEKINFYKSAEDYSEKEPT